MLHLSKNSAPQKKVIDVCCKQSFSMCVRTIRCVCDLDCDFDTFEMKKLCFFAIAALVSIIFACIFSLSH